MVCSLDLSKGIPISPTIPDWASGSKCGWSPGAAAQVRKGYVHKKKALENVRVNRDKKNPHWKLANYSPARSALAKVMTPLEPPEVRDSNNIICIRSRLVQAAEPWQTF
jgi:hypothetical protein